MTELPYTESNIKLIQDFIDETKRRITKDIDITFTQKAQSELSILSLYYDIKKDDILNAILGLSVEDYYRGIDPSGRADFEVCAFYQVIGSDKVGIYLKYGLETDGLQILIFSNHEPSYRMNQPFKIQ